MGRGGPRRALGIAHGWLQNGIVGGVRAAARTPAVMEEEKRPEDKGGYGTKLIRSLQKRGLSRGQIFKAISLQRLSEEVTALAREKNIAESILLEISRVQNPISQKALAEMIVAHNLPLSWSRELSRLVRITEKIEDDGRRGKAWDFFFACGERIAEAGATKELLRKVAEFRESLLSEEEPRVEVVESEAERERRVVDLSKLKLQQGRGLDVGTANIVAAVQQIDGKAIYNIQRNHFLDMRDDIFTKRMLAKLSIDWTTHNNRLYVVGDHAFELATVFEKEIRRPMKDGMISPYEPEALVIVNMLIHRLMGPPSADGELCAFSIPAPPVDMDRDNIYHQGVLESLLRRMGYAPKALLEGLAVVYAELAEEELTGIGISCGGGMFNICVAYKSIPAVAFSTPRGGDWVDQSAAKAVGLTPSQICAIKESGVDLANPRGRVEEAIVIYYRNLIQYTLDQIRKRLENQDILPVFDRPVSVVCAGGTALVGGFIEIFREELARSPLPVEYREVRLARDPLHTVSQGCLNAALQESQAKEETRRRSRAPTLGEPLSTRGDFSAEILDELKAPEPQQPPPGPPKAEEAIREAKLPPREPEEEPVEEPETAQVRDEKVVEEAPAGEPAPPAETQTRESSQAEADGSEPAPSVSASEAKEAPMPATADPAAAEEPSPPAPANVESKSEETVEAVPAEGVEETEEDLVAGLIEPFPDEPADPSPPAQSSRPEVEIEGQVEERAREKEP